MHSNMFLWERRERRNIERVFHILDGDLLNLGGGHRLGCGFKLANLPKVSIRNLAGTRWESNPEDVREQKSSAASTGPECMSSF